MAAIDSSIYQEITIFSKDRSESVDLRQGVVSFNYYEDLFSPSITAKMVVVSTSQNLIRGKLQSIITGLPIIGGELVIIKIAGNSENNPDLEFSEKEIALYVSSVSNVISDGQRELFTLNLVPIEALTNETTQVHKKYPPGSVSEAVKLLVNETLNSNKELTIDPTTNKYGFRGGSRKPFTLLTELASQAGFGENAGAFFYQTREGFFFSSVDKMITKEPKNKDNPYIQTEVNKSSLERDNDYRILSYSVNRNNNFLEKLRLGGYASKISTFDYWNGTWEIDDIVDTKKYKFTQKNLGQEQEFPTVKGKNNTNIVDTPSRTMTQIVGHGSFDPEVSIQKDSEPEKVLRQAVIRYNTLCSQQLQMTVPLNSNLMAGDIIKCLFPKNTAQETKEYDQEISGLYMIKELCHHFSQGESLTSMTLVRDTFGLNGTNNKN